MIDITFYFICILRQSEMCHIHLFQLKLKLLRSIQYFVEIVFNVQIIIECLHGSYYVKVAV